jgi:hypothetical protein
MNEETAESAERRRRKKINHRGHRGHRVTEKFIFIRKRRKTKV